MRHRNLILALIGVTVIVLTGCESNPPTPEQERAEADILSSKVKIAIEEFRKVDPTMKAFFDGSYGYAVFPEVTKGALVVGGAAGQGQVFEQGRLVGHSELKQGTIGAQIGGQGYSEIIFFKDKAALETFKRGDLELSAQASAVAAKAGASADADYESGVAIFTHVRGGLMAEASVGGQQFEFWPN